MSDSLQNRLAFRSSAVHSSDSCLSSQLKKTKLSGLKGTRIRELKVSNSLSKKLLKGTAYSTLKPKSYEKSLSRSTKPLKLSLGKSNSFVNSSNFPIIEKFPSGVELLEQELTERISNLDSKGSNYIAEVYELSRVAFQKVIELDTAYANILSLIKRNYEKFYEYSMSDLPTRKNPEENTKSPVKIAKLDEPRKLKIRSMSHLKNPEIPRLPVCETESVVDFQQEFLSHFDEFSLSWRQMLEIHGKTTLKGSNLIHKQ